MAMKDARGPATEVPDADRAVLAGGRHSLSVSAEDCRDHGFAMTAQSALEAAAIDVPDPPSVLGGAHQTVPVRAEIHVVDPPAMPRQDDPVRSVRVLDDDAPITVTERDQP